MPQTWIFLYFSKLHKLIYSWVFGILTSSFHPSQKYTYVFVNLYFIVLSLILLIFKKTHYRITTQITLKLRQHKCKKKQKIESQSWWEECDCLSSIFWISNPHIQERVNSQSFLRKICLWKKKHEKLIFQKTKFSWKWNHRDGGHQPKQQQYSLLTGQTQKIIYM